MKIPVGNGKPIRESSGTDSKAKASARLLFRMKDVSTGERYRPGMEKITIAELAEDYLQDYRINGRKTLDDAERIWRMHLQPWFGHVRASRFSSKLLNDYIEFRQKTAENATINRELSALGRMYTIALEATPPKVLFKPKIKKLPENNVRKGFLTDDPYEKLSVLCHRVGLWLEAMLEVGYTFGWRHKEVLKLRVWQVELATHRIILEVGSTKNGEGRMVKFMPGSKLEVLLTECCRGKQPNDYLFTRLDGKPVKDFRGVWWRVCVEAGVSKWICKTCNDYTDATRFCPTCKAQRSTKDVKAEGLLFHDLRRTAARNARAAGVHEEVIMKMGGWKTRSVFSRYAIIAESDMEDAARLIEKRRANLSKAVAAKAV